MDLSQARSTSLALDLDFDDEEAIAERHLIDSRVNYTPVYVDEPQPGQQPAADRGRQDSEDSAWR